MTNLSINTDLALKILTSFLHAEITRAGFLKAVVGLSGGVDSAVSCALAAQALGAKNVLAVRMPYATSSEDSLQDAQLLIDQLGVESTTISITEMVEPLFEKFPEMGKLRRGNLMARTRMAVLFDQSAAFNGLVIGTSNKSEILLGYSTQFGDSASALNPIGDLYKTQIFQFAQALDIPAEIINKPPSADLWPGQTDEKELGFTYEDVDKLLYLLVDKRYSAEECMDAGINAQFIKQVMTLIQRSQYKRVMPLIAKLSNRTIGHDFLYLRDWGT